MNERAVASLQRTMHRGVQSIRRYEERQNRADHVGEVVARSLGNQRELLRDRFRSKAALAGPRARDEGLAERAPYARLFDQVAQIPDGVTSRLIVEQPQGPCRLSVRDIRLVLQSRLA